MLQKHGSGTKEEKKRRCINKITTIPSPRVTLRQNCVFENIFLPAGQLHYNFLSKISAAGIHKAIADAAAAKICEIYEMKIFLFSLSLRVCLLLAYFNECKVWNVAFQICLLLLLYCVIYAAARIMTTFSQHQTSKVMIYYFF